MRKLIFIGMAGCGGNATSICEDLCRTLVLECSYDAFPTVESCQQGCEYDASQGDDIDARAACVEAANCDTFAVVECEHE